MKVLKEGNWHQKWEEELLCSEPHCGATLLADESDLHPVDYSDTNNFYVECPVCGTHVKLPGKDVPLRLQRLLNTSRKHGCSSGWD